MSDQVARTMLNGLGLKVVAILPIENATITKNDGGFQVPVMYKLEDGSTATHFIWKSRKKDVKTELDKLPCPPQFNLFVTVYNGNVRDECFF